MNGHILWELALNTRLLPESLSDAILTGVVPSKSDVIHHLIVTAVDAEAVVAGDPESTWNERRLARQALAVAFLVALVCGKDS